VYAAKESDTAAFQSSARSWPASLFNVYKYLFDDGTQSGDMDAFRGLDGDRCVLSHRFNII